MAARQTKPAKPSGDDDTIDLDAARAARIEQRAAAGKGNPKVKLGGQVFEFRAELPIVAAELALDGKITEALALLLVDPGQADAFMAAGLSQYDVELLMDRLFGSTLGE